MKQLALMAFQLLQYMYIYIYIYTYIYIYIYIYIHIYIYINDLTNNLDSNVKLYADDISLYSVLNNDLRKIREWDEQLRMVFNPDPTKQAKEVICSGKSHTLKHPDLYFNSVVVEKVKTQKHLGLKLDEKLYFKEHLKDKFAIVNKGTGMLN